MRLHNLNKIEMAIRKKEEAVNENNTLSYQEASEEDHVVNKMMKTVVY